jgi:hypothetical protein
MNTLIRHKWTVLLIAAAIGALLFYWNVIREPDWQASAIEDLAFMRDVLRHDHPGGADPVNPDFLAALDAAYAKSSGLAERVEDPVGYLYAVRSLTMPFQDAHLVPQFYRELPRTRQWPGFFVAQDEQESISVVRSVRDDAPQVGARLVSCDGSSPRQLYRDRVEPFQFRSWLPALAPGDWPWILIDSGNPFLEQLKRCEFEIDGQRATYALDWQPLDDAVMKEFDETIEPSTVQTTELRFEPGDIAWVSIASFFESGESVSEDLAALIDSIDAQRAAIADAEALVIDVRGNLGGASKASYAVAAALWNDDFINDRIPRFTSTDWRASDNNLDRIDSAMLPLRIKFGSDSDLYQEVTAIRDGMRQANSAGQPYFVQTHSTPSPTGAEPRELPSEIYFLTDHTCVSACLDFADLMDAIDGVTHIGTETSGDTFYLEVASVDLPSGIGQLIYPTAIHQGRARGVNESHVPDVPYPGDVSDTDGIVQWLIERRSTSPN